MKKEWKIFLTAVMFLTRIPVPRTMDHNPVYLQKSPKYFPVIGWIVGGTCALVFLVFSRYISTDIGILASMIAGFLLTGALHEDGFADVCDGFGGGWTKEKILLIMKDSRIGVFGAIGLISMLGSKYLLLKELPSFTPELIRTGTGAASALSGGAAPASALSGATAPGWLSGPTVSNWLSGYLPPLLVNYRYFIIALIAAHGLSRLMPVLVIQWSAYASDPDQSKAKPMADSRQRPGTLILAILLALLPFGLLPLPYLLTILPVLYATYSLSRYFSKWIGGYTGDCLGAVQQVSEIVFYLGFIIIWRYF